MNRDAWIPWIGGALILLVLGGIGLAFLGTYWGDPALSARSMDLLKVMAGAFLGFLGGFSTGSRQSGTRAAPAREGSRTGGNEEKNRLPK
jgi:hypothetical protein